MKSFWINELRHQCNGEGGLVICLAGNKCDLESQRQISTEEGKALASEYGAREYLVALISLIPSYDSVSFSVLRDLGQGE